MNDTNLLTNEAWISSIIIRQNFDNFIFLVASQPFQVFMLFLEFFNSTRSRIQSC